MVLYDTHANYVIHIPVNEFYLQSLISALRKSHKVDAASIGCSVTVPSVQVNNKYKQKLAISHVNACLCLFCLPFRNIDLLAPSAATKEGYLFYQLNTVLT